MKFILFIIKKNGYKGFGHNQHQRSYGPSNFNQAGYGNRDMRFNLGGYDNDLGFNIGGYVDPFNINNSNIYRSNSLARYTGSNQNLVNPAIQRLQTHHLSNSYREPFTIQHSNSNSKMQSNNHNYPSLPNINSNRLFIYLNYLKN